jgi:hypothetical protein
MPTRKPSKKRSKKHPPERGTGAAKKKQPLRKNSRKATSSSRKASKKHEAKKKAHKASPSVSTLFWKLREVIPLIEKSSYFDLSQAAKKALAPFEEVRDGLPAIEAWTFTMHPSVYDAFTVRKAKLKRYIITIDTRTSSIYSPIEAYLRKQVTNVTSFYSGGWADFLCDVQLDETSFRAFIEDLRAELTKCGLQKIEDNVANVLSIFPVSGTKIICGRLVESFPTPSTDALDEILKEPLKFESVHRNYRSDEAEELCGGKNEVRSYLRKLRADGIIVCFKIVFDFSFGSARDYVPMILGERREAKIAMAGLLSKFKTNPALSTPVEELLEIGNVESTDSAENEVKYFFINSYDYPAARNQWKRAIYKATQEDVNLYNYPLEGTLNETPVYLSDLPEFLNQVKAYEFGARNRQLFIGWAHHELLQHPPKIALAKSGLALHGITLGEPGSGKTSADLVLATEADKVLTSVVILDSGGVRDKVKALPEDIADRFQWLKTDSASARMDINKLADMEGIVVLEANKRDIADVFAAFMDEVEKVEDATPGYQPRKITKMLLVEEAGQVLGSDGKQKENAIRLPQLLDEAYRKGWCIWLSAQHPSSIAPNKDVSVQLLKKLKNRLILAQTTEVDTIVEVFKQEKPFTPEDESYLRSTVGGLALGEAICRGVELSPNEVRLPLIGVTIRRLDVQDLS